MKALLFTAALLISQFVMAEKEISKDSFKNFIKKETARTDFTKFKMIDIGGQCSFRLEENKAGGLRLFIDSEKGFSFKAVLMANNPITREVESAEEADYVVHTYQLAFQNKIFLVYVDGQLAEITIDTGLTKLSCSNQY